MSTSKTRQEGYPFTPFSEKHDKKEQERALNNFYLDPLFRGAVRRIRMLVPPNTSLRDEKHRKVFLLRARGILSQWGLHEFPHDAKDNDKWLAWLWRHWDPDKEERPVCPSSIREPKLTGIKIHACVHPLNSYGIESFYRAHKYAWVTITLFPGASRTQVDNAVDMARFFASRMMKGKPAAPRGGRPGMLNSNVEALHSLFMDIGLPGKAGGQRTADKLKRIREAIEKSSDKSVNSLKHWSHQTIANHYRQWRTSQGAPPRRYYTDQRRS